MIEELQAAMLGEEVGCWGEPDGSSTFAVDVEIVPPNEILSL